jgi:large subunit ribosomal protein L7/L12
MAKLDLLINEIGGLSVLELAQLTKALEELFGVSAASMSVAAPAQAASAEPVAKNEEKAEYKVELLDGGSEMIKVIKALRQVKKDLGLVEAQKMVKEAPSVISESLPMAEAKALKEALEAAGAKVKLS